MLDVRSPRLELFQQEKCRVNLQSRDVRRYLISRTNALDGPVTPDMLLTTYPYTAPSDPYSDVRIDAQDGKDTAGQAPTTCLRCKKCRHELAIDQHVVQHEPGKGKMAFEPHRRDGARRGGDWTPTNADGAASAALQPTLPPHLARIRAGIAAQTAQTSLLHSPQCSAYFVEPLKWMVDSSNLVEGELSGRLQCPNVRCNAKLGTWTWAGSQCAWYVVVRLTQWSMGDAGVCATACQSRSGAAISIGLAQEIDHEKVQYNGGEHILAERAAGEWADVPSLGRGDGVGERLGVRLHAEREREHKLADGRREAV